MQTIAPDIPGYTYGTNEVAPSPISLPDFERLKKALASLKRMSVPCVSLVRS